MKNTLIKWVITSIAILFAVLMFQSCKTPEQLAQKHLKKAIRLDPGIIARITTDTTIRGVKDTVIPRTVPAVNRQSQYFDFDSLSAAITAKVLKQKGADSGTYIYKDSSTSIQVKKDAAGRVAVAFHVKQSNIKDTISIPYEVKVTVPGKVVTIKEALPCWRYFWFWALLVALVLLSIICLRGRGSNGVVIVKNEDKTPANDHG